MYQPPDDTPGASGQPEAMVVTPSTEQDIAQQFEFMTLEPEQNPYQDIIQTVRQRASQLNLFPLTKDEVEHWRTQKLLLLQEQYMALQYGVEIDPRKSALMTMIGTLLTPATQQTEVSLSTLHHAIKRG